jgi:hypothetical protein
MLGGPGYLSFVWPLPQDPSGKDEPTSSYTTASMALKFLVAHKPPHPVIYSFVKVKMPPWRMCFIIIMAYSTSCCHLTYGSMACNKMYECMYT